MSTLLVALLALVLLVVILFMLRAGASFAPWIPSSSAMAEQALRYIAPQPGSTFVDLGCGDGRIVFLAHRKFGLVACGYEFSPLPYCIAKLRQLAYLNKPVSIEFENFFDVDLSTFDIIYGYGLPKTINQKLLPKLQKGVRPGTYVISYNFSFEDRKPLQVFHNRWRSIYIYRF